jgi:antitoxin VapB
LRDKYLGNVYTFRIYILEGSIMAISSQASLKQNRRVTQTTVFRSGNSQAIRIPKEFQFQTKQVEILRDGRNIVLRPVATTASEALLDLPPLSDKEAQALKSAMAQLDDLPALDEPLIPTLTPTKSKSKASKRAGP